MICIPPSFFPGRQRHPAHAIVTQILIRKIDTDNTPPPPPPTTKIGEYFVKKQCSVPGPNLRYVRSHNAFDWDEQN